METDQTWVVFYIFNAPDAQQTADTVLSTMRAMYSNAESPAGIRVYHRKNRDGDYVYYLSPAAAVLYRDIIDRFSSMQVEKPVSTANLALVMPAEPENEGGVKWSLHPA